MLYMHNSMRSETIQRYPGAENTKAHVSHTKAVRKLYESSEFDGENTSSSTMQVLPRFSVAASQETRTRDSNNVLTS